MPLCDHPLQCCITNAANCGLRYFIPYLKYSKTRPVPSTVICGPFFRSPSYIARDYSLALQMSIAVIRFLLHNQSRALNTSKLTIKLSLPLKYTYSIECPFLEKYNLLGAVLLKFW